MKHIIKELFYRVFTVFNYITPKAERMIFIHDARLMRQNCWAVFKYLVDNNYNEKYKIVLFADDKANGVTTKYSKRKNVIITSSNIRGGLLRLKATFFFAEYQNTRFSCIPTDKQVNVFLTHGVGLKKGGYLLKLKTLHFYEKDYSFVLTPSPFFSENIKSTYGCSDNQLCFGGFPRNDQLISGGNFDFFIDGMINVLWMPTFRTSTENKIYDTENAMPLINADSIATLNILLQKHNINLIIKLHPLQDKIDWLVSTSYSNIKTLLNKDVFDKEYELYELVGASDMLITDYSSVYFDYLLTDKPIIFAMDDIEEYKMNRGFIVDDISKLMPGPVVSNIDDLVSEIVKLNRTDSYADERKEMRDLLTIKSKSGSYSRDLLDFLNITMVEKGDSDEQTAGKTINNS